MKGDRGQYRGDIEASIDDFVAAAKVGARALLGECAKETPVLAQFHLKFS
jgi:hypothetical protein